MQPQRGASRPQPALPESVLQPAGPLAPLQALTHFLCFPFPPGTLLTHGPLSCHPLCLRGKTHLRVKKNVRVLVPPVLESVTTAVRNANSKVALACSLYPSASVTLTLPSVEKGCRAWIQHQLQLLPCTPVLHPKMLSEGHCGVLLGGGGGVMNPGPQAHGTCLSH